jgi:hypothetical protein
MVADHVALSNQNCNGLPAAITQIGRLSQRILPKAAKCRAGKGGMSLPFVQIKNLPEGCQYLAEFRM